MSNMVHALSSALETAQQAFCRLFESEVLDGDGERYSGPGVDEFKDEIPWS